MRLFIILNFRFWILSVSAITKLLMAFLLFTSYFLLLPLPLNLFFTLTSHVANICAIRPRYFCSTNFKHLIMKRILLLSGLAFLLFVSTFAQNTIDNAFFQHVPYRGAFGSQDWTSGWTNWNPQNTNYPVATNVVSGEITQNTTWESNSSPLLGSASFANTNLQDAFFTQVSYIGAFGNVDWTQGWANWTPQFTAYGDATVTVENELTANTTWTASNIYLIKGFYYVRDGVTLTIEPGTVIRGDKDTKGSLIIERGAKLIAEGTSTQPIVFTSNQAAGSRSYGDWGGVILCGKAVINVAGGVAQIEGGPTSQYGGTDDADNSGSLKYIRIEFPGVPFVPDKEINGLTFGAVGSGTTIDNIQVSYAGDDSYEWFGGTVNVKHLIAFRGWDDEFDTDYGFRGKLQFLVALRDNNVADPGSGSNGFESDNDGQGSTNSPVTKPVFCNVSLYGPRYNAYTTINSNFKRAMHIRRNSSLCVYNSVFSGYPTGLFLDGDATQTNATANQLQIENCLLSGMSEFFKSSFERSYFLNASRNNDTLATNDLLMLADPFNLVAPNFIPSTGNTVYLLNGFVYVVNGVTLTIKPGTIIRGDKDTKGSLIIERGAKLIAEGTAGNPIVFTSNQPVGSRAYGDWGGVILCGKAVINVPGGEAIIEGGPRSNYGGTDDADNSGSLKYVRVEFPGIPFVPDKEINGITFGGIGSGTTVDYIQVSYSGDDSYEWFGGTVNARHLIAFRGWDDEFDTDYGYRGMQQFCVALRDPAIADPGSGSNGFESDNDATGTDNLPQTQAIFSNFSLFGPKVDATTSINSNFKRAMHIRRNSALNVYNTVITGYPTGLFLDGDKTQANASSGKLNIKNTVLAGMGDFFKSSFERSFYTTAAFANDTIADNTGLGLNDAFNLAYPDFRPLSTSVLMGGSLWDHTGIEQSNTTLTGMICYPNPVAGQASISLQLSKPALLGVQVYDFTGRLVKSEASRMFAAGSVQLEFSSEGLENGVYLLVIHTNEGNISQKIVVKK